MCGESCREKAMLDGFFQMAELLAELSPEDAMYMLCGTQRSPDRLGDRGSAYLKVNH